MDKAKEMSKDEVWWLMTHHCKIPTILHIWRIRN